MMELSVSQSEKNQTNGSPSLHHHQFVYPADLRVLGYALPAALSATNNAAAMMHHHHQQQQQQNLMMMSPPSPTNLSVAPSSGSSSIGSPSHLSSANGFSLPRNLIFSDPEKAAFFWANNSGSSSNVHEQISSSSPRPTRDDHFNTRVIDSPNNSHQQHPHHSSHQVPLSRYEVQQRLENHSSPASTHDELTQDHSKSREADHGGSPSQRTSPPLHSPPSPGSISTVSINPHQSGHIRIRGGGGGGRNGREEDLSDGVVPNSGAGHVSSTSNNNGSTGETTSTGNNLQLMNWMSAVMAERQLINHQSSVDGVHYVWNGGAGEGKLNSPENHHNSIKSVDQSSPHLPHLYGAPRSNNSGSSVSSSPPSSAGLVVPQPLSSGLANSKGGHHHPSANGTGRKYNCKMCPQIFSSKADMQLHTQIHMREAKPYKCSYESCRKAFANSSYLSQHTRIHLGIKPYRCEICQRKFTQLSHLQQHIRTHTGDKPYKCRHPGCNKAFSQLSNLQSHSRCHETEKKFRCNSCYKCFFDESSLLDHIPKHKESKHLKTHVCLTCGKSYTQETYLTKHMQKHAEKTDKRLARQNNNNHHQTNGTSNGTNGQSHQINNHQNSNSSNVLPSPEMYWKAELGESSPPSMCLPGGGQSSLIGRPGSEGPDDLRLGHHQAQSPTPTSLSYDAIANVIASKSAGASAFTPIQTLQIPANMASGGGAPGRAYLPYEPLSFQKSGHHQMSTMDMKSPGNSFPNQLISSVCYSGLERNPTNKTNLISLHQIRNYAHQPSMTPEHLLGLKDK
ncbi:zinc finger protein rotund isoform X4 [Folsomia candida]|uniref:zinc finger protein rotund isoform X4 n=1 Tax=Folsomia candida TaxID=158441 RepID=UPI001605215D|nr:zinc finger protein rotund isoform X4 [Folsomia candida]